MNKNDAVVVKNEPNPIAVQNLFNRYFEWLDEQEEKAKSEMQSISEEQKVEDGSTQTL